MWEHHRHNLYQYQDSHYLDQRPNFHVRKFYCRKTFTNPTLWIINTMPIPIVQSDLDLVTCSSFQQDSEFLKSEFLDSWSEVKKRRRTAYPSLDGILVIQSKFLHLHISIYHKITITHLLVMLTILFAPTFFDCVTMRDSLTTSCEGDIWKLILDKLPSKRLTFTWEINGKCNAEGDKE